ncbi:HNH endonuclease family protein [Candidatus Protofrankia californiensis]|uniref:HNH endonuclease family protein n=1 Tax=Candidatus Protofrankia californiensis TaxID=1839754 RepID=UPI0010418831|nr:HNH endonuclease family protein [Candidatus Protofrankia californiensis]
MPGRAGRTRTRRVRPRAVAAAVVALAVLGGACGETVPAGRPEPTGPPAHTPLPDGIISPDGAAGRSLRAAITDLPVTAENRTGYTRETFEHWVDADTDGCTTRSEVLIAEAVTAPSVGAGCRLTGGAWRSYYDDATWTNPTDLDIDHLVPLAEAWDSGASTWTDAQRRAYANDLDDPRSLVAVTDRLNQAKGDKDPAAWMPPATDARCRYLTEWVAVKIRWRLAVDTTEKTALTSHAATCPETTLTVTAALA